jgi:D-xylose transport system substrate-binding protein
VKKSDREIMEILEAYDATGCAHSAAALAAVDPKTVRVYVAKRAGGIPADEPVKRPKLIDPFVPKIEEAVEASEGAVRADVLHERLVAMGFTGDERTTRRAVAKAKAAGIPVIGYDRLIEDPSAFYLSFDNVGVGKAEADAVIKKVPKGNYVLIKGDPGDPNAKTFLPQGWDQAGLKDKIASGDIKIIGPADGTYTDAWKTEKAQANMEAIIDSAVSSNQKIDAILAENDSTALGVVGALTAKSYGYPPLSGQDGDPSNLNNVALGKQYVDVWKNSNELGKAAGALALALCNGGKMESLALPANFIDPAVAPVAGLTATPFKTPGGNTVNSIILQPTPITADNLQVVVDAKQISKADLCKGVDAAKAPAACK